MKYRANVTIKFPIAYEDYQERGWRGWLMDRLRDLETGSGMTWRVRP